MIVGLLVLGTVVATLLSFTGYINLSDRFLDLKWYLDLTSNFKVQYLIIGFSLWLYLTFARNSDINRRNLWRFVSLLCIAINLCEIAPWYIPQPTVAGQISERHLRVLVSNVLYTNNNYSDVISLVREEKPDIAVFIEVNDAWLKELEVVEDILPYSLSAINPNQRYGTLIYSNQPLENTTTKFFEKEKASLLADLTIQRQKVSLIATHPSAPLSKTGFEWRNKHLEELGKYVAQEKNPVVVIGDLNISMWSPYYKRTIRETGLHNTRAGFGILPTWPTQYPFLYIPLDHCLVSADIQVVNTRTAENVGSDHLPVIADLVIPSVGGES